LAQDRRIPLIEERWRQFVRNARHAGQLGRQVEQRLA
jgi:hypothetical protein